jgi:hypothetical protein
MSINYAEAVQRTDSWGEVMAAEPDIMYSLIQDVLKIVQSQVDTDRVGRRPAAEAMDYDALWAELFPKRYSEDLFPVALRELMGSLTQGQFAMKVPCSQQALSWILSGKRQASLEMMAACATAGGVSPAFFFEWRTQRIAELVTEAVSADPKTTITMAKRLAR